LRDYVLSISTVNVSLPEGIESVVTPYPPTPFQSLIFYCSNPVSMGRVENNSDKTSGLSSVKFDKQPHTVLVGPQLSRVNIKVHRQLSAVRVDFLPGGIYRMLGIPMSELFDGGFDANDFFGAEMKEINDQLLHITHLEQGKIIVEEFLLRRLAKLKEILPIDAALRHLLNHDGNVAIEKTASLSCLSLKQFERKCKERIGMNPKVYARILKFSKAYRLHEAQPNLSWTKIAYDAGYYDQMHMIRDFRVFAGVNPSIIQQQLNATPIRMQKDLLY